MTALSISTSTPARSGAIEPSAGFPNGSAAGISPTARSAIRLTPIATRAQKEDLTALSKGADDESNGEHGRAAREVGRRAATMRCSVAITAA